ncbi:MAG: alpha/beta hydrolase-fold protein [Opitutaceae bacterium]|nr:alpha/beta hydrolase-fold protein [Opitutaceae bacterium]
MKSALFPLMALLLVAVAPSANAQTEKKSKQGGGAAGEGQRPRDQTPSWLMPEVKGANLHYRTFDSKAAGTKVSYLLYLPPDYETSKDRRYPVVFWLHGIGGSQQGIPALCARISEAITAQKAPPAIFVFVNGMVDSFYCDALAIKRPVETVIVKELIPHVDATYHTLATRAGRMIEGFSMGGFGAGHLGFKYPELFGSVSIIDGALLSLGVIKGRHAKIFQRVFGGREGNFTAAHPLALAERNAAQIKGRTLVRQSVGALAAPNETLHAELSRLGIEHDYDKFDGVGHNLAAIYEKLGDRNWKFYSRAFAAQDASSRSP